MLTEIEIEDVGTYRLPNMWQQVRIRQMASGPNKDLARLAFGLGMTLQQFKKLTPEHQGRVREAFARLTSPSNMPSPIARPVPAVAMRRHNSPEQMVELGRRLIQIKAELPHGHFGPWVRDHSGLSYQTVQRYLRIAHEDALRGASEPAVSIQRANAIGALRR